MPGVDSKRIVSHREPNEPTGRRGFAGRLELLGPVALVVAFLLPFLRRAFSIDDPLFIWIGQRILEHPLDPYGFSVNWGVMQEPMSVVMQNPPLDSYFIAGVIRLVGLSELRLHAAFLLPAIAVAWGTYLLARRFCTRPIEATLAAVLTPAFLVCGSTVMCDMMMVAFWVWAIHFWVKGADENRLWMIVLASVLIAFCALTKYFGAVLIPLLLVYHLLAKRRPAWWLLSLLIPVVALIAYNHWTEDLYGKGLVLYALGRSGQYRDALGATLLPKTAVALAFAGGCLATIIFLAPLLWTRRALVVLAGLAAALTLYYGLTGAFGNHPLELDTLGRWLLAAHIGVFAAAGASLLTLAVKDLASGRDADSALLFLWLAGTAVFVCLLNWTVNGRVLLPAAPALGIVMMRQIERRRSAGTPVAAPKFALPWVLSAVLAVTVAHADYELANSQRLAAYAISQDFSTSGTMWFQGHWGFQYYMELRGAKPLEFQGTRFGTDDMVVIPENNTCVSAPPDIPTVETAVIRGSRWLSTMSKPRGTAFHSDAWGPVPYGFGLTAPEIYYIVPVNTE